MAANIVRHFVLSVEPTIIYLEIHKMSPKWLSSERSESAFLQSIPLFTPK